MKAKLSAAVAAAALFCAGAAFAAPVTLTSHAYKEVATKTADGRTQVSRVEPNAVAPGDDVLYVLTYQNGGAVAADALVITNPVPRELTYVAAEGASVSVDGGQSFGPLAQAVIRSADGASRPASPADVTHVRWALSSPVPAGGEGEVSYRAKLK